jgi:thiamine pyrophosphokinase
MLNKMISKNVIVADGSFPTHHIPLEILRNAEVIVCCDGSAESLIDAGFTPDAIVGDMDSLPPDLADRYSDILHPDRNQETNDLTKAVEWCREMYYNEITILGATGKREDHTLGNISLLAEYAGFVDVQMITDTGIFIPFNKSCTIQSFKKQQVSIFSIDPNTEITSAGLKYPLNRMKINNWWVATLNESTGESFSLDFTDGKVIVYLKFRD